MFGKRLLASAILALTTVIAPPAMALPTSVRISQFSELEQQVRAIEAELGKRGLDRMTGVTLRLQNYLEDVVILAGRSAVLSPEAIADFIEGEAKQGADKRTISSKLVEAYKANRFRP